MFISTWCEQYTWTNGVGTYDDLSQRFEYKESAESCPLFFTKCSKNSWCETSVQHHAEEIRFCIDTWQLHYGSNWYNNLKFIWTVIIPPVSTLHWPHLLVTSRKSDSKWPEFAAMRKWSTRMFQWAKDKPSGPEFNTISRTNWIKSN